MCLPLAILAPIIGGAIAGGGSAVAGAVGSANAAAAQEKTVNDAMSQQKAMWEQQRADQAPWLAAGRTSLADLMEQMQAGSFNTNVDPSQMANDQGYQFRMAEGQKALERSASARGMLASGGALKSLSRYSQGLASDEFQNIYARNQSENTNRFNRLASLSGIGQASAQNLGALGAQNSAQMSGLYGALGNAQSAGAMGMANAISGGFQSLGNGIQSAGYAARPAPIIPSQYGYAPGAYGQPAPAPTYGQSTMGYPTQGFGPWR
jgi:hypothetical protein